MKTEEHIVNAEEVEWHDESHGERYAMRRRMLSLKAGGAELGCSLYEIPAGRRAWPMHYHFANEEAIFVLEGRGTLRLGGREAPLRAGDYVALPAGPGSAHQVVNDSAGPLRYLCFSTMKHPDVAVYPDSGKLGVFAGSAPGASPVPDFPRAFLPLSARMSYWDGEE